MFICLKYFFNLFFFKILSLCSTICLQRPIKPVAILKCRIVIVGTVHTSFFLLEVLAVISLDIFSQCKAREEPSSTRLNSEVMIRLMSVIGKLMRWETQVQVQVQAETLTIDVKQSSDDYLQLHQRLLSFTLSHC